MGRVAQWGTAAGPNWVGAQEASRAEEGVEEGPSVQQMGATVAVQWRGLDRCRRAASSLGWREKWLTSTLGTNDCHYHKVFEIGYL